MDLSSPLFWTAVLQIIAIDLVLSGDNAVVIALACRNLPSERRRIGIFWGVLGAVGLRIVLTAFASLLMGTPWIKLAGGLLLLWIAVKLQLPDEDGPHEVHGASSVSGAIKTIILADFVMSLDNVVGVAGASRGSIPLLMFGLLVSIPIIVGASQLIMKAMERVPLIVSLGAALLGWVAGSMILADPALRPYLPGAEGGPLSLAGPAICACGVLLLGHLISRRRIRAGGYREVPDE